MPDLPDWLHSRTDRDFLTWEACLEIAVREELKIMAQNDAERAVARIIEARHLHCHVTIANTLAPKLETAIDCEISVRQRRRRYLPKAEPVPFERTLPHASVAKALARIPGTVRRLGADVMAVRFIEAYRAIISQEAMAVLQNEECEPVPDNVSDLGIYRALEEEFPGQLRSLHAWIRGPDELPSAT